MPRLLAMCLWLIAPTVALAEPPAQVPPQPVRAASGALCPQHTAADDKLAAEWMALRRKIMREYPDLILRAESLPADVRRQASPTAQELRAKLAAAEAGEIPPPFLGSSLTTGEIGTLWGYRFRVIQRLGPSEATVGISRISTDQELGRATPTHGKPRPEVEVLLRGFDLSGVADGQDVQTRRCFIVRKPEAFKTAGAPRTMPVIEPYDSTIAEMLFERFVSQELWNATHPEEAAKRQGKAAEMMARMARRQRAASLRYPALLANARSLIAAKLYDPAEKMLRRIVTEAPGTDAAEQAKKEIDSLPPH
jgi:hypothetical protein